MMELKIKVYSEQDHPEHIIYSTIDQDVMKYVLDGQQTKEYVNLIASLVNKPPEIMDATNEKIAIKRPCRGADE